MMTDRHFRVPNMRLAKRHADHTPATNRIARCFCDIHAVTQHGVVSSLGLEQVGRAFLGMEMGRR
jgi:hypothetical protein